MGLPASGSELTDFRQKAAESVKDVVYIVGTDKCVVMVRAGRRLLFLEIL